MLSAFNINEHGSPLRHLHSLLYCVHFQVSNEEEIRIQIYEIVEECNRMLCHNNKACKLESLCLTSPVKAQTNCE